MTECVFNALVFLSSVLYNSLSLVFCLFVFCMGIKPLVPFLCQLRVHIFICIGMRTTSTSNQGQGNRVVNKHAIINLDSLSDWFLILQ